MTHDESSIEPPTRVPFSRTSASARARGAGQRRRARPCRRPRPCTHVKLNVGLCSTYSIRTRFGPPQERRVGVRRIDDGLDLDVELSGIRDHLVCRLDQHGEMVEQRPLRLTGSPSWKLDEGAADLDPRPLRRARSRSARTPARSPPGRRRQKRDVVEVVLDVGRRLTSVTKIPSPISKTSAVPVGQLGARGSEVGYAQPDVLQGALLTRGLRHRTGSACRGGRRCRPA